MSPVLRRLRHSAQATTQGFKNVVADTRLFFHGAKNEPSLRSREIDGLRVLVCANEEVGRDIYFYGEYEAQEFGHLIQAVEPTDVCVDIGANVGFYTISLARQAHAGTVHSFEPVPLNYHIASTNVLINNLPNVVLNGCAVGECEAELDFFVTSDSAFSSFLDTGRVPVKRTIKVPVTSLDSYCAKQGLERVDIMKVDVEGAEERVIQGAAELIRDSHRRPRLIMLEMVESMLMSYSSSIRRIVELMRSSDYWPWILNERGLAPFEEAHHNTFYNVFFIPKNSS